MKYDNQKQQKITQLSMNKKISKKKKANREYFSTFINRNVSVIVIIY